MWCEHSEPPVTHGFGQQATAMLDAYAKLWRVLDSMAAIKHVHAAVTSSAPPLQARRTARAPRVARLGRMAVAVADCGLAWLRLQAYQPEELQRVARDGQQEVRKVMQEMEVLAKAAQRQRAEAAAGGGKPWAVAAS